MPLTLLQGGKVAVRAPRPSAPSPLADDMITVPRSSIVDLIREFNELKAMWDETKEAYRRILSAPPPSRRRPSLSLHKEVTHV